MAYTEEQLDKLKDALASGVLSIRYQDGRQVTYKTTAELVATIDRIESTLGTKPQRQNSHKAVFNRGW